MAYLADPGGVFASDTHRRVLAHLPLPDADPMVVYDDSSSDVRTLRRSSLWHRLQPDVGTSFDDPAEVADVLADLEAEGFCSQTKAGWKMTKKGLEALNAPVPETEA